MPATTSEPGSAGMPRVTVFGPNPLLTVAIEPRAGDAGGDDIHLHAGGQGVWVSRSAATLGAEPLLCGFVGSETGTVLAPLLESLPGELHLIPTTGPSGCYVVDRREGTRRVVSQSWSTPPSRHEIDDLFSATCAAALASDALVVCNPFPEGVLPLELYANLVADARGNDVPVYVDLSSPRLDSALEGRPDLVKLNDWELAEFVAGPVDTPARLSAAARRIRERGAATVVVTRGERPALVIDGERERELAAPRLERGYREGCGDAMMGAMAALLASGEALDHALVLGAAAGAATFLRHGLATGKRDVIEELAERVRLTER
jgi:1-phosphofructokinase